MSAQNDGWVLADTKTVGVGGDPVPLPEEQVPEPVPTTPTGISMDLVIGLGLLGVAAFIGIKYLR